VLLSRLDHHVNEYARAREEMEQVLSEMQDAQDFYSSRLHVISARLDALPRPSEDADGPTDSSNSAEQLLGPLQLCSAEQGLRWFLEQQRCHTEQMHAHACSLFAPVLSKQGIVAAATSGSSGATSSSGGGGGGGGCVEAQPIPPSLAAHAQLEAAAAAEAADALNAVALDPPGHLSFGLGCFDEMAAHEGLL
jgi:hypothetical protein